MKIKQLLSLIFASVLLFTVSCTDDGDFYEAPRGAYENGIFVVNEGNFGTPNASVSFVSQDLNYVEQNIYKNNNNNEDLGDVLQTIGYSGDYAYLVLNNSNKVTVVNRYNFKKAGEITSNINQPRYIGFANNYIYVTNDEYMGDKYVTVYKNSDLSFVKKIDLTDTAERIAVAGGTVFVQNSSYGYGNKITLINSGTNDLQTTITVPNGQVQKIVSDNNNVYAIASDTALSDSYIYQISSSGSITNTTTLTGIANATHLNLDNGKFYFSSGMKIYSMDMSATTVPTAPILTAVETAPYSGLYGLSVIDGKIFTADANNFTANSKITVYNSSGAIIKTFDGGRATNSFFKN